MELVLAPEVVEGAGGVGRGDWPWTEEAAVACVPLPDPPLGAMAAPRPGWLAGFQGVEMPPDEEVSESDASAAVRASSTGPASDARAVVSSSAGTLLPSPPVGVAKEQAGNNFPISLIVRRGSPDPAVCRTEGLPPATGWALETFGRAQWQGRETLPQLVPGSRPFQEVISSLFLRAR